jgi:hypothetical protein
MSDGKFETDGDGLHFTNTEMTVKSNTNAFDALRDSSEV